MPAALVLTLLQGCGRFSPHLHHQYVYVWVKEMYLRDRVAPVNERVARATNGERLEVVQVNGRFTQARTPDGKVGWLPNETVINQATYDKFQQLARDTAHDPVLSKGILRESYWLRDAPGRTSDRFYLLPRNTKLELLQRVSLPKPEPAQLLPAGKAPAAPVLEDFWLARDSQGQVGWVRGGALDEDVPEDIAVLIPGEKVVAAYVIREVHDPESSRPNGMVPEYVAALTPWKSGLPFDFDQLRVFTWNVRKHRYETAYMEHDLQAYLPVTIGQQTFGKETDPVFSFTVATNDSAHIDAKTGRAQPGSAATESFRMQGVIVRRTGGPVPEKRSTARK